MWYVLPFCLSHFRNYQKAYMSCIVEPKIPFCFYSLQQQKFYEINIMSKYVAMKFYKERMEILTKWFKLLAKWIENNTIAHCWGYFLLCQSLQMYLFLHKSYIDWISTNNKSVYFCISYWKSIYFSWKMSFALKPLKW